MELRVLHALDQVRAEDWDALLDPAAQPFLRHAWLSALELSGCVHLRTGWAPRHLALFRGRQLISAMPMYLKDNSDGDFSRDWGWAGAAERADIPYYPKLIACVPFTPVTGRRVLSAPGESRAELIAHLFAGARALAVEDGATSVHVLFPTPEEAAELEAAGLARRVAFQYHWRNAGYRDAEEFLGRFDSKRRNQARRERGEPARQGITLTTLRGEELMRDPRRVADDAYSLHRSTVDKLLWGRHWLNREFYRRVFDAMPESLELVEARRDGRLIAGAFNVATPTHLYGRYWGCLEEHRFLHFNVCLYHSIDDCIRRGIQVFEGGAGGEHKIARGFEPMETYSAHQFLDPRLDVPLRSYIAREAVEREQALARWRSTSPIFRRDRPGPGA